MTKIKGTNVAAPIVPYTTNDNYPTHYAKYGKGGFVTVADLEERDQIPVSRLEEGMLVYVISDPSKNHLYQYFNQEWEVSTIGKSTSLVVDNGDAFRVKELNGNLIAYNKIPAVVLGEPTIANEYSSYIKINSFYLGGQSNPDEHSKYNYCSHYYVELANISDASLSLDGLYLKKTHKKTVGGVVEWDTLALTGEIPAHSTYIIRGPQCAIMDSETTYVKVRGYNQEWDSLRSTTGEDNVNLTLYLCWGEKNSNGVVEVICNNSNPQIRRENPLSQSEIYNTLSYVDCVGLSLSGNGDDSYARDPIISGMELTTDLLSRTIFQRKCPCDPSYTGFNNCKIDWRAYNLVKGYSFNSNIDYTNENSEYSDWVKPSASYEGKTKADRNVWFEKDKPTTVTCTIGRRTAICEDSTGEGNDSYNAIGRYTASRCFTWTTLGKEKSDQFIWVRKVGNTDWNSFISIKDYGTSAYARQKAANEQVEKEVLASESILHSNNTCLEQFYDYYKCQVWEAYTGEVIATHRAVLLFSEAGVYEYFCGEGKLVYDNLNQVVGCNPVEGCISDVRTIKIQDVDDGTLDPIAQVGNTGICNREDGILWNITSGKVKDSRESYTMLLHSGNIVKDGTRPEEWISYINNNELAKTTAEFLTLGRDDLGSINLYELGTDKVNPDMMDLFYTFELNFSNAPFIELPTDASRIHNKRVRMPGLYSTQLDSFSHICSVSTPIVTYPGTEEVSTVFDVFGAIDPVIDPNDFPGECDSEECVVSTYYRGILNWLFYEIAISKGIFFSRNKELNENLFDDTDIGEGFIKSLNSNPADQNANGRNKCEHFIILMNRPPISPIDNTTDELRNISGSIRSLDVEYDGINTRLYYIMSRLFKCWGIRLVIGSCDQISGLTLPIYDAPVEGSSYSPFDPQTVAGDWFNKITGNMSYKDTFSPVISISSLEKTSAIMLASNGVPVTVFWNGTNAPFQVNSQTYAPGSKNVIDPNQGVLSLELCEDDSDLAPQYSLLQTTTNRFGNAEHNNYTVGINWFDFNLVNGEISRLTASQSPMFMVYENFCGTYSPKYSATIKCYSINNVLSTYTTADGYIENLWDITKYNSGTTKTVVLNYESTISLGEQTNN